MQFRNSRLISLAVLSTVLVGILFMNAPQQAEAQNEASSLESVETVGTAFTYQGRLTDNGNPANGTYDFIFELYDAENGGSQIGVRIEREDVSVTEGYFSVQLDFGSVFSGSARFVEIGVRPGEATSEFTQLSPRRPITPSPYAIHTTNMRFTDDYIWKKGMGILKLIHIDEGFCFLTRVGGGFAGGGEYVQLNIRPDGYWYLEGHSLQGGDDDPQMLSANARCVGNID